MSKKNPLECKICKIVFKSKSRMMKHLISKQHMENLKKITIEPLDILNNNTHTTNDVDPFLNKNDISKLKNMDIGDGFDITYKNENIVKCEYVFEEKEHITNTQEDLQNTNDKGDEKRTREKDNKEIIKEEKVETYTPPVITDKQSKIIDFLIKNQNHQQVANKFFQVLQKLPLEDLKGFTTHIISNDDIQILIKQKMIKVFKIYKETLIKKKESGQTLFNNILIDDIVSLIVV